ncbi:hypothetical protein ACFX1R_042729 [Malus domestica]
MTSFATKRDLACIISRGKMNATRHTTPVTFPPKSYEGCRENQPAINFINRSKSKATVAMAYPSKSHESKESRRWCGRRGSADASVICIRGSAVLEVVDCRGGICSGGNQQRHHNLSSQQLILVSSHMSLSSRQRCILKGGGVSSSSQRHHNLLSQWLILASSNVSSFSQATIVRAI